MSRNMAVIGAKGSDYGLWIAKVGFDAFTASDSEMILSMGHYQLQQILYSGVKTVAASSVETVLITDRGFISVVEYNIVQDVSGEDCIKYPYLGPTVSYGASNAYDLFVKVKDGQISFHNESSASHDFAYRMTTTEVV